MDPSKKYSLNADDLKKILKGVLLAAGGCVITYLATEVLPNIEQNTVLGSLIGGGGAIALNALRKWFAGR